MPAAGRLFPLRGFSLFSLLAILFVGCSESDKPVAKSIAEPSSASSSPATPSGTKRLIFLTNGDDPFWDTCTTPGSRRRPSDLAAAHLAVDFQKNDGTPDGQINKLRQYGTEADVAGVAISVIQADNVGIAKEMKNLMDAGIEGQLTVDGDVNRDQFRSHRTYYIGTDNFEGGKTLGTAAGRLLKARKKETGAYVQFAGFRVQTTTPASGWTASRPPSRTATRNSTGCRTR